MLLKKIIVILIIVLNIAGIGYLLYIIGLMYKEKLSSWSDCLSFQT